MERHPVGWCELGGHGGGRTDDVELAASLMADRPKADDVRVNIVPSSRHVFAECLRAGLVERLHANGATWFPASGGSNQAINMGAMTQAEAMISTQSPNLPGRNGSRAARMYLASPLTVAASALTSVITDPREYLLPWQPHTRARRRRWSLRVAAGSSAARSRPTRWPSSSPGTSVMCSPIRTPGFPSRSAPATSS